jgi:hypothetical protein
MNEFYTKQEEMRVLLHVNGQTHGFYSESPLKTQSELPRTAEDMFVMINCSELSDAAFSNIFMPSRDRFVESDLKESLKEGIFSALEENDTLREEEAYRREQMTNSDEMTEFDENTVEELVNNNPELSKFFKTGEYTGGTTNNNQNADPPQEAFEGSLPPTRFNIIDTYRSSTDYDVWNELDIYTTEVPINRTGRIRFELNAPDGYFTKDRASLQINKPDKFDSSSLRNGIFSLRVKPTDEDSVGESEQITVQVTDAEASRPMRATFKVQYTEEVEKSHSPQTHNNFDLPEMYVLTGEKWEEQRGNDPEEVIEIVGYKLENMDVYINGDSNPVNQFLQANNIKPKYEDRVKKKFNQTIYFNAVSAVLELDNSEESHCSDNEEINNVVQEVIRGQSRLTLTNIISESELKDWSK